jgi:hypothetical protein
MSLLPDRRVTSEVRTRAENVGDEACHLVDAAGPDGWDLAAVEDAVDAVEVITAGLARIDPQAARLLTAIPGILTTLRHHFGAALAGVGEAATSTMPSPRRRASQRRGLGHGWQGVRIPGDPVAEPHQRPSSSLEP